MAGLMGSPKSTVTVMEAELVGETASVDRSGGIAVWSKVTRSSLDSVLSLPAGSVTLSARMDAVTLPSADGVMVKVKVWLPDGWARLEAVPLVTDMSSRMNVAGSIGSPKSTVAVMEAALVRGGRVSRQVGGRLCTVEGHRGGSLEAVLSLPAGSMMLSAGMEAVTSPSADGRRW